MASVITGAFPGSQQTKILVVDGRSDGWPGIVSALREMGQEAVVVRSASEALLCLKNPTVGAVIISPGFAEAEGYELLSQIRMVEGHRSTPVLFAGEMPDPVIGWLGQHHRLRETESRLRSGLESADLALWSMEPESGRIDASARMREMFSLSASSELFVSDWLERVAPEDRERVNGELQVALSGAAEFDCEFRVLPPDRNFRWIASRGNLLRGDAVSPAQLMGVSQDVTERRIAEEVARNKQKLESLGLLAGGIAHDFNNLLTGILGHSSLVLEDEKLDAENRECIQNVMAAAESAAQLTRQMLAYSGRGRFVVESVALSQRVRELLAEMSGSLPTRVRLVSDLAEDLPPVEMDTAQLRNLVANLVRNGAEAVGTEGGLVQVTTRLARIGEDFLSDAIDGRELPPGTYVVLEVKDDGHGMDSVTQARIFDPFFTTKFTGRGLGLAAVLGIVRGHKGAIQLRSKPGKGTVFTVFFPPSEPVENHPAAGRPTAARGSGLVLVVDDEETIRRTARTALERHGFQVLVARNGLEGVETFREASSRIALVLLDMGMPVMSGEEAFRKILEIRPGVPVVATSGYDEEETRARFGEGLAGFLQKPYTSGQLAGKVKECAAGGHIT